MTRYVGRKDRTLFTLGMVILITSILTFVAACLFGSWANFFGWTNDPTGFVVSGIFIGIVGTIAGGCVVAEYK